MSRSSSHKQTNEKRLWQITPARDLLILIGAVLLSWLLYTLRGIFIPLFLAFVLADIFNPLVTWLEERWRWPRSLTVAILLVAGTSSLAGLFAWLGPLLL